ncbi:TonB family protein [Arsukibacterium indicum]|uniref:TonB family protein n=1 Tax=Arsukibacterium indicum TaxID=2848612 RepID=A0ABS6MQG7_9GAMM|nr:TonB family protein [Arsukibacterium indicum]MBV2130975.1 TonB family protein [Arsukibacterium indicum]
MRGLLVGLAMLTAMAQADMLDALKAYENSQYDEARQQFSELLPLGNAQAAFNMAAMFYHGQGQAPDLTAAAGYFHFASYLNHPDAEAVYQQLVAKLDEQQQQQAEHVSLQLRQSLKIQPLKAASKATHFVMAIDSESGTDRTLTAAIKTVQPTFPRNAAMYGVTGYVRMRYLVDGNGNVRVVDVVDAFPQEVFERSARRALLKFEYPATGQFATREISMTFSLKGGSVITPEALLAVVEQRNLWVYAIAGSPQYQEALGTMLSLLGKYNANNLIVEPSLPLDPANPDWSVFTRPALGKEDHYIQIPEMLSADFWWQTAAANGNSQAQRLLSIYDDRWANYLFERGDGQVLAWRGVSHIIDGNIEQGNLMLDRAIASGYPAAMDLKSALTKGK